ncbi:unnamed protein product [Musa banksii]
MGKSRGVSYKKAHGERKRRRDASDDEEDKEYLFGAEDEDVEEEGYSESLDADATEEEFEFGESTCGSEEEREIDYDDEEEDQHEAVAVEEEVESPRSMPWNGRAQRSGALVDDEEEETKDWFRSCRRNLVALDYAEEEEDDDDHDEDFLPDDGGDDSHDEEEVSLASGKKGDLKRRTKKRKSRVFKQKRSEKRIRRRKSDDDDDDSDFPYSKEGLLVKNRIAFHKERNKLKNVKRRKRSSVISESSSDSDYMIFELDDLVVGGAINPPKPINTTEDEEKGKEKEGDELQKQICGICLAEERTRTIQGELDCCAHFFCFKCIMEWSKVESRCPVCKRRFSTITKSSRSDPGFGMRKVVSIQVRNQVYQPSEEEIRQMLDPYGSVVCTECQQDGDDGLMLLCDICDSCAHTYCVGLGREVPEGSWYCDCCRSATNGSSTSQNQSTVTDERARNGECLGLGTETEVAEHINATSYFQQSISLPPLVAVQRIDLNAPPTLEDDHGATLQDAGGVASTLSGRRAIHHRICILLSNSRRRPMFSPIGLLTDKVESDVMTQKTEESGHHLHSAG